MWVLLEDVRKHGVEPDFKLFATILYYIAAFTQRFHHPKEDDYLFKLLLSRTDRADAVIDELKAEHARGPELVGGLERALVHYQGGSPIGLEDFARLVERYTAFILEHMRAGRLGDDASFRPTDKEVATTWPQRPPRLMPMWMQAIPKDRLR